MRVASRGCGALRRNEPRLLSRRLRLTRGLATVQENLPNVKADEKIRASARKGNASNISAAEEDRPRSIVCGAIVTDGQNDVNPEDVVSKLPTLSTPMPKKPRTYHAVLLLSRSHATWLADHRKFLRPVLQKMFLGEPEQAQNLSKDSNFDVLSVVVDRIPDFSTSRESTPMHVREADGIAYYAADAPCILPDLWDAIDPGPKKLRIGDTRQSTISFKQIEASDAGSSSQTGDQSEARTTVIKLPLANTVFQTGSEFTISASRWTISADGTGLEASRRIDPKDRTILMLSGKSHAHDSKKQEHSRDSLPLLSLPFLPLTFRREIKSGMGNIIRQLMDVEQAGLPASSELEQAVSDHFVEHNMQPHLVSVWALLMPRALVDQAKGHVDNLQRVFKQPDMTGESLERFQASFRHLVMHGATLHRVLSGGGGWGAKAGLLSLDPATDFGEESSEMPTAFDFGLEMTDQDSSQVGRLASPGDSVQFFLATPPAVDTTHDQAYTEKAQSSSGKLTFSIGVAHPTEETTTENQPTTSKNQLILRPGHFGALSESGFSFKNDRKGFSVQTKIDVPGASFTTSP